MKYFLTAIFLAASLILTGCPGSGNADIRTVQPDPPSQDDTGPVNLGSVSISEIEGPDVISEYEIATYSVDVSDDSGLEYKWSCDPPEAGVFGSIIRSTTGFRALDVPDDLSDGITLNVEITASDGAGVVRSRRVAIGSAPVASSWMIKWHATGFEGEGACAIDRDGNIFVGGKFMGTQDFDPGPGVHEMTALGPDDDYAYGVEDAYISMFAPDSTFLWAVRFGSAEAGIHPDIVLNLDTDSRGNVYAIGSFSGECDFDPGPGEQIHTSQNDSRGEFAYTHFLISFNPDGEFRWVRTLGGSGYERDVFLAVDTGDNVLISGEFTRSKIVEYMPDARGVAEDGDDVFLAKFNSSGDALWYKVPDPDSAGNGRYGIVTCVDTDSDGNSYITGWMGGAAIDLDPGPGQSLINIRDENTYSFFLSKFGPGGDFVWGKFWGEFEAENPTARGHAVCVDSNDNPYVTGYYSGDMDFNPNSGSDVQNSNGALDCYIVTLDPDGNYRWATHFGGPDHDVSRDIAVGPDGYVYVTGYFRDSTPYSGIDDVDQDAECSTGYLARIAQTSEVEWQGSWDYFTRGLDGAKVRVGSDGVVYVFGDTRSWWYLNRFDPAEYWQ